MDFDELATRSFQVTDSLDSGYRARLGTSCQCLDMPVARASLSPAEYRKVDEARRHALGAALVSTWELVEESRFDVQVLAVLMRLAVEVEGIPGAERSLGLIHRMISDGWREREVALAALPPGERERLLRQWSRYFDSVFEQIYGFFARESELRTEAFAAELRKVGSSFIDVGGLLEAALTRANLRSTWWQRTFRMASDLVNDAQRSVLSDAACARVAGGESASSSATAGLAINDEGGEFGASAPPPRDGEVLARVEERPETDGALSGTAGADSEVVTLRVSERFWALRRSMTALETLLKKGEYEKARIVARDLEETLGAFDVAGCFPGLFAPLFELSARFSEELSNYGDRDPLRVAALQRLYRSDLGRFLSFPLGEDT